MPSRKAINHELPLDVVVLARDAFGKFDLDNSGTIDAKELRAMLHSMHILVDDDELREMMLKVDTDKSGEIDWDEFLEVVKLSFAAPNAEEEVDEAYLALGGSRDHTQTITMAQIKESLAEFGLKLDEGRITGEHLTYAAFKKLCEH